MFSLFALWHWLLCSWHLSPFPVSLATLLPVFLSFYTLLFYMDIARALCVRACVRLYIRV